MASISKATEYNWKRLNSDSKEKLTKRANKTQSKKRIIATAYLDFEPANQLMKNIARLDSRAEDIIYSLCVSSLEHAGILGKQNVQRFLSAFSGHKRVAIDLPDGIWDSHDDVIGFIYQSLIPEGQRNLTGQYYTNRKVVDYMLDGKVLKDGETFLDPCCGSGAFLLAVTTDTPSNLYGLDINPVAVMIAGTNLLVKYADHDFCPNVYCLDFLRRDLWRKSDRDKIPFEFDNIYTNPPWGTDKNGVYLSHYPEIKSKERSSMVIVEGVKRLKKNGVLYFLLPTSLLKIKVHNDIRKYILANSSIKKVDLFSDRFDGVFTDFFSIKLLRTKTENHDYDVTTGQGVARISLSPTDASAGQIKVEQLSEMDVSIIGKIESRRHDDLTHSLWALGIVTGDNKSKVKKEKQEGMEPVYVGKDVVPYRLLEESSYIRFAPETFQQCAREEFFRASEKLIYRFIGKYPIVAYDDKQRLCLNSANILIPQLKGISIKSTAALLNSALYRYYYSIKFSDIKVLKGNLQDLPFPQLTQMQDEALSNHVTSIQATTDSADHYQTLIDDMVFEIFEISPTEQSHIKARIT